MKGTGGWSVSVKDRMMYSHTFTFDDGKPFTTGCTAVVTATLEGKELGPYAILIDIIVAQNILREVMELYDHKNLDTLAAFKGRNTTVEVMAKAVCDELYSRLAAHHCRHSMSDGKGLGAVTGIHIDLEESDVAKASYFRSDPSGLFSGLQAKSRL